MNKQRREDYGNAQNTVPSMPSIPNTAMRPDKGRSPHLTPLAHPFRKSGGSKNRV